MVALPYGRVGFRLDLGERPFTLVKTPAFGSPPPTRPLIDAALDAPLGSPRVEALASSGARVTVIVSDATRDEPRATFLEALRARLPGVRWTIAVATGTHGPSGIASLGIPTHLLADAVIVDHDGHRDDDLVALGTTRHGTVARVHRCVVDSDLVIATGCIRPHYFAGFGAGVKAIFPGLGAARDVRHNHQLKGRPGARAGIVEGNPCRADLEEAVAFLSTPTFLLDGLCASDGAVHDAVAGHLVAAFRAGVERARRWFTVSTSPADLVIASDVWPVTASIYQASKIAAAAAPLVKVGGMLLVVAECANGIGPGPTDRGTAEHAAALTVVNEAILRIGVLPRLAAGAQLGLISSLPSETVSETLFQPITSITNVLNSVRGSISVIPRASQLLII